MSKRDQTRNEEIANAITHGLGILFTLVAVPILALKAIEFHSEKMLYSALVFGFGMLMSYSSSTIYHAVQNPRAKRLLRIWDHISIFFLIGGSYTPLVLQFCKAETANWFLTLIWSLIVVGSLYKLFFTGKYRWLSTIIYIALGGLAVIIIEPLLLTMPKEIFYWVLGGGIAYIVGTVFYMWHRPLFTHAIWHVFVLTGTVSHFIAVFMAVGL